MAAEKTEQRWKNLIFVLSKRLGRIFRPGNVAAAAAISRTIRIPSPQLDPNPLVYTASVFSNGARPYSVLVFLPLSLPRSAFLESKHKLWFFSSRGRGWDANQRNRLHPAPLIASINFQPIQCELIDVTKLFLSFFFFSPMFKLCKCPHRKNNINCVDDPICNSIKGRLCFRGPTLRDEIVRL